MAPPLSPTGFWCNAPQKWVSSAPRSRGDGGASVGLPHFLLNTLAAITCKEAGFQSLCAAWADTTTTPGRTVCYQAAIHSRGGAARASDMRSRGLSSPDVRHVAIGHGEAAHVSLAPGPEPCSLIVAVAPRRLPRDVTCPVADRGGVSCIMLR